MKSIVFELAAAKQHDALPAVANEAVMDALVLFALEGRGDVKKLIGSGDLYRLRVGRYRVMFEQSAAKITVVYVGKRETTTYR